MGKKSESEYEKPRFFRDRRDKEKISSKREAPKNPPYERPKKNWTHAVVVDGLGEDDFVESNDPCQEGYCECDKDNVDDEEKQD